MAKRIPTQFLTLRGGSFVIANVHTSYLVAMTIYHTLNLLSIIERLNSF
ncbi:MAG: hypothetical protein IJQ85_06295 [Selenomonadaceae bacterium]|nr:hypothetical protein [Selenomonadaceae bacterium]